jgi:hypothetical protein
MMKKAILFACAVLLCGGAAFGGMISEDPGELHVSGLYWFAGDGDFDLFDNGYGLSASYREWFSFPFGVGVNVGVEQWQVDGHSHAYRYKALSDYDGDVLLMPVGASMYFNMIDWDNWNLVLDAGLKYLFVDSNVSLYSSDDKLRHDVDIGGAVVGNLGAEYEYMVSESVYLLAGVGYQFNVMQASTEYSTFSTRDTSFAGAYLRLGGKFLF